jgi:hypothetical protein
MGRREKSSHKILNAQKIKSSLSSNRGISHSQEGGGNKTESGAPHIHRSGERRKIRDDPAAYADKKPIPAQTRLFRRSNNAFNRAPVFSRFSAFKYTDGTVPGDLFRNVFRMGIAYQENSRGRRCVRFIQNSFQGRNLLVYMNL